MYCLFPPSTNLPHEMKLSLHRFTPSHNIIQLYAITNFHGSLTMIVNEKNGSSSFFSIGFREILSESDVELPGHA